MPGQPAHRTLFLRNSADIERVKQCGHRVPRPLFNLVSYVSGLHRTRMGIIVGKRFGGAVMRNRAKRIFRELARRTERNVTVGYDVLVFPKRGALTVRHAQLWNAWTDALRQDGLLTSQVDPRCDDSASG